MPWWGWIVVGAALLAAEMAVDSGFYLFFLGASALAVGVIDFAGLGGPAWRELLAFAAIAAFSMVAFRRRVYARLRPEGGPVSDSVVGEHAVACERIEPGAIGRAELRGTVWSARNAGETAIPPGTRARVESVEGLILSVRHAS